MMEEKTGAASWPVGGGETGALIRAYNWSQTPLGPIKDWPQSLKTAVDICLASPTPVSVLWGAEFLQLYNDAYVDTILQQRHPAFLGRPSLENWPELREFLLPIFHRIFEEGTPILLEDYRIVLRRGDEPTPQERFFTLSLSAIRDESGVVAGIFHHANETTTALLNNSAAVQRSEERYRNLFTLMDEGYYVIEVLFDETDKPIDFCYIEANPAFEKITGLVNAVGKTVRECVPGIEEDWIEKFGAIALTGEAARFGGRVNGLDNRWYEGYAFRLGGQESRLVAVVFSEITERKNAEEALLASERMLALIYDNSPDCLYLVQIEPNDMFRFVSVNATFLEISGYTREQVDNAPMEKVIPPDNISFVRSKYKQVIETRQPVTYEETALLPNGLKHAEITLTPIFAPDDSLENILGVIRDVTERKQTEIALRESEQRFRTLSDTVPQIIWTNSANGTVNYVNRRSYEYTGLAFKKPEGVDWDLVMHPEDVQASNRQWQKALDEGQVFDMEYRLRRYDGTYRWHIGRNVPLRDSRGSVIGWFGSATDIEDLKQAEAGRRESEERFRLLVEGARDYAMFLLDAEGIITFWSRGAERIFGWSEQEALGQNSAVLFTPEDRRRGEPENEILRARTSRQTTDQRWQVRQDGSRFWADGILMRLDDEAGGLRGFAKVARDATEQKRGEDELRASEEAVRQALEAVAQANEELERRVEVRTEELARMSAMRQELLRQLVTAQEEERGRISRDLHDDTGQHVTALLLGLSQLESSASLGGDQKARETLIRLQAHAGEVAKKSHRLSFTLRPTALDDIGLMGALQNYTEEWGRWSGLPVDLQGVRLEKDCGGAVRLPSEIETTIYRVAQEALTNVLRHAVMARNKGEKNKRGATRVSIVVQRGMRELVTTIEDDGPGFDMDAVMNLPPGRRRLGIFGMQERARLAGGTLTVESAANRGTTIFLRLPLSLP